MIPTIIIVSLQITAIYTVFQQGNILSPIRAWIATRLDHSIGKKWSKYIQKPLWDCLPCMSSVWTITLTWGFDLFLILAVCGLLVILRIWVEHEELIPVTSETKRDGFDESPTSWKISNEPTRR